MATPTNRRPPGHLARDGRNLWRVVCADFEVGPADAVILEAACTALDRAVAARKLIDLEGIIVEGPRGGTRAHPAIAVERSATRAYLGAMKQLGLEAEAEPQPRSLRGTFESIEGGRRRA